MKTKSLVEKKFYLLLKIFVIIVAYFLIPFSPPPLNYIRAALFPVVAIVGLVFLVQGIRLALIARKEKGKLKLFLMITGIAAVAPLPFALLHNVFYGLAIAFENLKYVFEPLSATSFIIAIIIAPLLFIAGVVGSIILFKKAKKEATAT